MIDQKRLRDYLKNNAGFARHKMDELNEFYAVTENVQYAIDASVEGGRGLALLDIIKKLDAGVFDVI